MAMNIVELFLSSATGSSASCLSLSGVRGERSKGSLAAFPKLAKLPRDFFLRLLPLCSGAASLLGCNLCCGLAVLFDVCVGLDADLGVVAEHGIYGVAFGLVSGCHVGRAWWGGHRSW